MNKIFLTILITTLIASTAYFAAKPVMIKEVRFYDSSLNIENQEIEAKTLEPKIVPPKVVPKVQPVKPAPKVQPKPKMTPKPTPKSKTIQAKPPVQAKKIVPKKIVPQKPVQKTAVKKTKPIEKPKVETKVPIKTKPPVKTVVQPKPVKTVVQPKPVKTVVQPKPVKKAPPTKKVLSEREETIVWNQWRANVENEIIRLSNFKRQTSTTYPPSGTKIFFDFDVDISGNISNISIKTVPASQLNNAKNYYIPLIMMMNRKPVLKFPEGTKRTNVTVSDGIRILTSDKNPSYADSTNYADYEKVKIRF